MSTDQTKENLATVQARIAGAARACGRDPAGVRLVAVSKTVEPAVIQAAYDAGQRAFGENRAQDLQRKALALPPDCEWHMIGHVQTNKVRPVVRLAAWIHSVDSPALLERLERIAAEEGRRPRVLIEINVAGELNKTGAPVAAAEALLATALACPHLDCRGFMTMAPYGADSGQLRHVFGGLRDLRDRLAAATGAALPELSMGMSGDFEVAIEQGATMVRVGTAIFGARH